MTEYIDNRPRKEGKWIDLIKVTDKKSLVVIETEYKGNKKEYAFDAFNHRQNPNHLAELDEGFKLYKNQLVKIAYGISESNEWNGKRYASASICWNIENAGEDSAPVPQQPDIQRAPVVDLEDDEDDLPF